MPQLASPLLVPLTVRVLVAEMIQVAVAGDCRFIGDKGRTGAVVGKFRIRGITRNHSSAPGQHVARKIVGEIGRAPASDRKCWSHSTKRRYTRWCWRRFPLAELRRPSRPHAEANHAGGFAERPKCRWPARIPCRLSPLHRPHSPVAVVQDPMYAVVTGEIGLLDVAAGARRTIRRAYRQRRQSHRGATNDLIVSFESALTLTAPRAVNRGPLSIPAVVVLVMLPTSAAAPMPAPSEALSAPAKVFRFVVSDARTVTLWSVCGTGVLTVDGCATFECWPWLFPSAY